MTWTLIGWIALLIVSAVIVICQLWMIRLLRANARHHEEMMEMQRVDWWERQGHVHHE